jgi:predicted transcriptional regulator
MAKLSKVNTYAIQWLNSQGKNIEEIATDLSLTEKQVSSVVEKTTKSGAESSNIKTAKSPSSSANSRSMNLMIRETAGKKSNSVSIMTGEASMVNDQLKSQSTNNQQRKTDKYIFRPKQ